MNKVAEIYYHLNDAVTAIGRANAAFRDISVKWPAQKDVTIREHLVKANQAAIDAQNMLCECLDIRVPENERRDD